MLIADRYRLDEVLGSGGMGEVWRATDEVLGRRVAVKLLSPGGGDEAAVTRFTLEARTAARLNHPNTVAVYDFGTVDDRLYLVMELVDGYSLATELAAFGRLRPRRTADLGAQAAAGLAAAHQQHIVHRDIKPANLLLTSDDTLKIGDFGIARFTHDTNAGMTGTGLIIGTTSYLSPERALGRASGPPADMYALGCVLYELLTGRPPFRADNAASLLYQHVETEPDDPRRHRPDAPEDLTGLVLALLSKDPDGRPTAQQVADRLTAPNGRDSGRRAPEQPPTRTLPRPTDVAATAVGPVPMGSGRSRRRYLFAGAAALAAVAAVVATLTSASDSPRTPRTPRTAVSSPPRPTSARPTHPATTAAPTAKAPAATGGHPPRRTAPGPGPKGPARHPQPPPHPKKGPPHQKGPKGAP